MCDKLGVITLKEGDQQLGRLRGVLGLGRATDAVNGPISTNETDRKMSKDICVILTHLFFFF